MKIYLVGGAVRDKLLGLPVKERDWVVVGATTDDMLKQGFRQVGKEFPVFLHPKTNEEYALARMERKVSLGYKGFTFDASPDVSLEDDLLRRDLTINAMAEDAAGNIIDPYRGKTDLDKKILRHVSPSFSEDPVRVLRIARFHARYHALGFRIASETIELMRHMVDAGEINALVPERVWKELDRALGEKNPEKFFEVLDACGALHILFSEINMNNAGLAALITAEKLSTESAVRFAALTHALPDAKKAIASLCDRYRIPNAYRELAQLIALHYATALRADDLTAEQLLQLFSALDIYRRKPRFAEFLIVCQAIAKTKNAHFDSAWLANAAQVASDNDIKALLAKGLDGDKLADEIRKKRLESLVTWLPLSSNK